MFIAFILNYGLVWQRSCTLTLNRALEFLQHQASDAEQVGITSGRPNAQTVAADMKLQTVKCLTNLAVVYGKVGAPAGAVPYPQQLTNFSARPAGQGAGDV